MEAPMTITPELKQAVEQAGGRPVRIEDPETHAQYVILKAEVYDRMKPDLENGHEKVSQGIRRSRDAFLNALPDLLKTHKGRWACFRGGERIGIAKDKTSLVRESLRRGFDDYYVGMIVPHPDGDEVEEIEDSFVEFDA
jgi:hypothetical protein